MAQRFNSKGFLLRLLFAVLLVFISYNPSGYSYFHWANHAIFGNGTNITPPFAMATVVILIGWTVYLRATFRSLGGFGLILAFAFFAIIIWWLFDLGVLELRHHAAFTYIALFLVAAVLAVGMSWSHIRRRLSGQADMDDVDD